MTDLINCEKTQKNRRISQRQVVKSGETRKNDEVDISGPSTYNSGHQSPTSNVKCHVLR